MRAGNAILIAFFIYLSITLPVKILTNTYDIDGFLSFNLEEWAFFSFALPFIFAITSAICGREKKTEKTPQPIIIEKIQAQPVFPEQKIENTATQNKNNNNHQGKKAVEAIPIDDPEEQEKDIIIVEHNVDNLLREKHVKNL